MRLWSLHPRYLDAKGLVALWREALLAQAVLRGETRGYTRHPQLLRFQESSAPRAQIAAYLRTVHDEARRRGYSFDSAKIKRVRLPVERLTVTSGQLEYEWSHLVAKLKVRDPRWLKGLGTIKRVDAGPGFTIVKGGIEGWERP